MRLNKYIWTLATAALGLAGCLRDSYTECPTVPGTNGKSQVTVSMVIPGSTEAKTRFDDSFENDVTSLDLLLYNVTGGRLAYRITIEGDNIDQTTDYKSFKIDLPAPSVSSDRFKIVLIANATEIVDDVFGGNTDWGAFSETTVNDLLYAHDSEKVTGMPMWGETETTFTLPASNIPTIQMIRAGARFDISVNPKITHLFEMKEWKLPYSYINSRIVPDQGAYSHSLRKVTVPSIYDDEYGDMWDDAVTGNSATHIMTAEYANKTADDEFVFLINADYGPEDDRVNGWYKVRLLDKSGARFDILRNHRYAVTIKNVAGPGFPTEEEALESYSYVQAEVVEWNENSNNIIFDGNYMLLMSHTKLDLYKESGYIEIMFASNYPGTGDKSGADGNFKPGVDIKSTEGLDGWSLITKQTQSADGYYMLAIEFRWDEFTGTGSRQGSITVAAGNMEYAIHITQVDQPWLTAESLWITELDGMFHEVEVTSQAYWGMSSSGTSSAMALFKPSTTHSSQAKNIYFRTISDPDFDGLEIVTLTFEDHEYHYPPVKTNVVFGSGNFSAESNCYIVNPGESVLIPVSIANRTSLGTVIDADDQVDYKTIWSDQSGISYSSNIQNISILGKGSSAYLLVKAGNTHGNAVIGVTTPRKASESALPETDVVRWSWHIWVTDYDPATQFNVLTSWDSDEFYIMTRSLGALRSTPGTTAAEWKQMRGLYYQWGRKDPFPLDGTVYAGSNATTATTIDAGNISSSLKSSIMYPLRPHRTAGTWNGSDGVAASWGTASQKGLYDPCPEGWRVPAYSLWARQGDVLSGSSHGSFTESAVTYEWLYWPGAGGYYACQGLRSTSAGNNFNNIINTAWGYHWTMQVDASYSAFNFSFKGSAGSNNSAWADRSVGNNVRCVKE